MSLYEKYRPQDFDAIIGNTPLIASMEAYLKLENHSHAILFMGSTGSGKTTLANILARKLGAKGVDIIEKNVGDLRGIDDARDILPQLRTRPIESPVKVFILEEVQMGMAGFFNLLLRPLEETPAHVYFILTTTEPQKIPETIRNRCVKFTVQPLPESRIAYLLQRVADAEGKPLPNEIKDHISRVSQGIPRDALSMLENVLLLEPDQQVRAIQQITTEESDVIELCRALASQLDWAKVSKILTNLQGTNIEQVRITVLNYFNKVLLSKGEKDPVAYFVIENFKDNFYSSGKAGLTKACFDSIQTK